MAHTLIIGMTESGKTIIGQKLAAHYVRNGIACIILDPLSSQYWPQNDELVLHTRKKREFLDAVRRSRSCAVFVDEAGESVGQYDEEMHWLATRARHYGHASHFLTQRGQQVAKTVRDQCAKMYLFACSKSDGKILADEWNQEELREVNKLGRGEFFLVSRFDPMLKGKIEIPEGEKVPVEQIKVKLTRTNSVDAGEQ